MKLFVSDYRALIERNAAELARRVEAVHRARTPTEMHEALDAAKWTFARIEE